MAERNSLGGAALQLCWRLDQAVVSCVCRALDAADICIANQTCSVLSTFCQLCVNFAVVVVKGSSHEMTLCWFNGLHTQVYASMQYAGLCTVYIFPNKKTTIGALTSRGVCR